MNTGSGFDSPHTVDMDVDSAAQGAPQPRLWSRRLFTRRSAELITSARRSPAENRRSREMKYLILQGMRIPFVLLSLAAVVWWHSWVLAFIFFAISIPLPWISVVIANDSNEVRDRRAQNVYKPAAVRHEVASQQYAQLDAGHPPGDSPVPESRKFDPGTIDHH